MHGDLFWNIELAGSSYTLVRRSVTNMTNLTSPKVDGPLTSLRLSHIPALSSLGYPGDTRPCRLLEQAGRGATLLIHEATFEPALSQVRGIG